MGLVLVRRRTLLAGLAATAAITAGSELLGGTAARADDSPFAGLLVARIRSALLGPCGITAAVPTAGLEGEFTRALADFDACRYAGLAVRLPRLISAGQSITTGSRTSGDLVLLARTYLLTTRTLVKVDENTGLGWVSAERARQCAEAGGDPLLAGESARQLAVLARRAGQHSEALSIALSAADQPDLRAVGRSGAAARGLLILSASYTLARQGDRAGMRELTNEAAAIARELGGTVLLRGHGGFSPLTVDLHRIGAEVHGGDPLAALAAARSIPLAALPSIERRSRALGDIAITYERLGRRSDCLRTLLAAERLAPQEAHTRPATKALIYSLLRSGPTSTDLRGLARRSGVIS
ncbi:XRE family transcriptional regulator [Streptacidiphilus sp. EB103A]|uniref:XRE family transcriptional regulator n=1 Tax=Streptacidiphilus sp. EB103A TaxID=3156275 RepID=UPI003513E8A6